jgi:predicted transcriptional regulator
MPRRLGVSLRTVRYHLDRLEHEQLLHRHRAGRFVRWFRPGDYSAAECALISAARVRGQRLVLEALAARGALRWVDLASATRLSKASLSWHLRALVDIGIVTADETGRYRLTDPSGVAMGLALHNESVAATMSENAREIFEQAP